MIYTIGAVAAGGALGAVMRHGVNVFSLKAFGDGFPLGTLAVNVVGCFLAGIVVTVFDNVYEPSEVMRRFLLTGMVGAFTTFSTFSLDTITLWERGDLLPTALYVIASLTLSIAALFFAMWLIRSIIA